MTKTFTIYDSEFNIYIQEINLFSKISLKNVVSAPLINT